MGLDFTVLDFETANSHRGSPCSGGLVRVRDAQVVADGSMLHRPPEAYNYFDAYNMGLHGIGPRDIADRPTWPETFGHIVDFIGDDVVVMHNAAFQLSVLRQACIADELSWPTLDFFCTMLAARRRYRLAAYRLPFVAHACGFEHLMRYHAAEDAATIARVGIELARQQGAGSIADLAEAANFGLGHMERGSYSAVAIREGVHGLVRPELNPDADPDHALYGRVIVLTGALMSMTRQMAWDELARVGAIPELNVTKRTNVLVVGDVNPAFLKPGETLTGKAGKAASLQQRGQDIELMAEDDLIRSL